MDSLIKISGVLMLIGIGQAKDLLTSIQGMNATIYIDTLPMDVNTSLEINFSGYINNRHFTNVMLYHPRSGQKENISINSNYTGRIEGIVWSNVRFSFLLLNANLKDSGNYTVRETYFEKGNTGFLVARLIVPAHPGERTTLSFKFPETTTSMIKIGFATFTFNRTVLLYNVTKENCTTTDIVIVEEMEMQKCALKTGEFSFTFRNISWLHNGIYFAWDGKGRLLDSVFIKVEEHNKDTPSSSDRENGTLTVDQINECSSFISSTPANCLSTRYVLYIGVGNGAIVAACFIYCLLQHRFRFCSRENRPSNSNHTKAGRDENLEETSLERCCTFASDGKEKPCTAVDANIKQYHLNKPHGKKKKTKQKNSEEITGVIDISVATELDEFMNPIYSGAVKDDEYINPVHS